MSQQEFVGLSSVKHRIIARLPIERNEPVRIRVVKVKGAKVSHRQKFKAEDDWLSGLMVTIKNRTQKTITFVAIDLQFPKPVASEGRIAIHTLEYGNRALLTNRARADNSNSRIAPGQSMDLKLIPNEVGALGVLLTATGHHSGAEKLLLSVGQVIFEDDTMWYAGTILQRHPSDSATWVNTEQIATSEPRGRQVRNTVANAKANGSSISTLAHRWDSLASFEPPSGMK